MNLENLVDVFAQRGAEPPGVCHHAAKVRSTTAHREKISPHCFLTPRVFHGLSFLLGEVHRGLGGQRNQNFAVISMFLRNPFWR